MKTTLPFRSESEKRFLNKSHPLTRFILPFIFVLPFLIIEDIYLIITILLITLILGIVFQLHLLKALSRLKIIIPLVLLITIFIPFYIGETILYQLDGFIKITIFQEGVYLAFLIFLRVIASLFIFMLYFTSLTYSEFIEALTKLRIPRAIVGSLIIMLHYIPILAASNKKILESQEIRGKKISSYWQKLKTHAYIMGKSILTNMERSEKLYESLKMRGFSGGITFITKNYKIIDFVLLGFVSLIMVSCVFFIDLELIYSEVFRLFLQ
ncbi:MAG: energy-coupling factor transporter transmembrane component T family protein [Candidatus Thorarchaeota archaeon]